MSWVTSFLTSSIGRKLVMSLTGLFLITFLIVHLLGNLQLLVDDGGVAFNAYAKFMTTNPLIKITSYGLYFFILLHTVVGIMLWSKNKSAKGSKYAVSPKGQEGVTWASKNMALLGTLVFAFLLLHMGDFWWNMKMDNLGYVEIEGEQVKDLYTKVSASFSELWIIGAYLVGLLALAFHLWHGFQSAFQTLGLNHPKYTPLIQGIGKVFSIVVPLVYAIIPIYFYLYIR